MKVFKRKRRGKRDRNYTGDYLSPLTGTRAQVALRVTDKRVAEEKLRQLVQDEEREAVGLALPKPLVQAAALPLAEHLRDYLADLKAQGRARGYLVHQEGYVKRLLDACGWRLPRDVTPDGFATWRARQRLAPRTLNHYLAGVGSFFEWMRRHGRISANPLASVGRVETRGRERCRRALTPDEARRLVAAAGERAALYLVALRTGLRRGELHALLWSDVGIDSPRPFVQVRASTSKNHKAAVLPLAHEAADALRELRESSTSSRRVFAGLLPKEGLDFLKADLLEAGIAFEDPERGRVDFHALRHTFCSHLHACGVGQRIAQDLMRHSDPRLTASTYTDTALLPLGDAVDALPLLVTDGSRNGSHIGTQNGVTACHRLASGGESMGDPDAAAGHVLARVTARSGTLRHASAGDSDKCGREDSNLHGG